MKLVKMPGNYHGPSRNNELASKIAVAAGRDEDGDVGSFYMKIYSMTIDRIPNLGFPTFVWELRKLITQPSKWDI